MPNSFSKGRSEQPRERKYVYKLQCPKCGHVGVIIRGYDFFDLKPTGNWRCLKQDCRFDFSGPDGPEWPSVPAQQIPKEFR